MAFRMVEKRVVTEEGRRRVALVLLLALSSTAAAVAVYLLYLSVAFGLGHG